MYNEIFGGISYAEDLNMYEINLLLERLQEENPVKAEKLRKVIIDKYEDEELPYIEEIEELLASID